MLQETIVDEQFRKEMARFLEKPEGKSLFEACSESVILFAKYMLGINLYSWQVKFLHSINQAVNGGYWTKEFLALTSRQIGKSTAVAILSLWAATFNKKPGGTGNSTLIGVISASDQQAKKLLLEIKKLMRIGGIYMKKTYGEQFEKFFDKLLDEHEANNTTTITFKNYNPEIHGDYLLKDSYVGSTIKSYPPTSVVLGETFTILVEDEAGKSERITDQFHDEYASPTGDAFGAIRIYTSTPWTLSGFFYRLADPENMLPEHSYERFMFSCDAIREENPEQYSNIQTKIKGMVLNGKKAEVDRAYYCRFVKGEKTYFDPEKVRALFTEDYEMVHEFKGECDLGVDFGGKTVSRSVITISRTDDEGNIHRLYHKTYPVNEDDSLMEDIAQLMKDFNVQRIIPDECPQGDYLIREMKDNGWNVHPMNFRKEKVKKYGAFRAALNRGVIHSYRDDDLQEEMNAMETSEGSSHSIIKHAPGYTDDLIDSFVMSAYFFVQDEDSFKYYDLDDYDYPEVKHGRKRGGYRDFLYD